ncbi:hypothetical protein [Oxalobacter paraformigenes]|uniref:hypothetical protein n=1 Tax=Oxalobacter paraformigenes TaxID=556268 RepID=UPI000311302E|nr:hypothetical protein [Oxalobacter paraformigenes]
MYGFTRECFGGGLRWIPFIKTKRGIKLNCLVILVPKVDWLALADERKAKN